VWSFGHSPLELSDRNTRNIAYFLVFRMPNTWTWPEVDMYVDFKLNRATFQDIDWFGCYHLCLKQISIGIDDFFEILCNFETSFGTAGYCILLIRLSPIHWDCSLCLFKCWALSLISERSLLHCLSWHQTSKIGWTFIDPISFLDSSVLYLTYT